MDTRTTKDIVKALRAAAAVLRADTNTPPAQAKGAMSQPKLKMAIGRMKKILEKGYGGAVTAKIKTLAGRAKTEYIIEFGLPASSAYGTGAFKSVTVTLGSDNLLDRWDVHVSMMIGNSPEDVFRQRGLSAAEFERLVLAKPGSLFAELIPTFEDKGVPEARW